MLDLANLTIAIAYAVIPIIAIWVLVRHGNYRQLPALGVGAFVGLAAFVASCGWGHYLHAREGIHQPWDNITAIVSALNALIGLVSAERLAGLLQALLLAEQREKTLSKIFQGFPVNTALVLARGNDLNYLETSPSFEGLYGFAPDPGASHYDLFPGIKRDLPQWVELHQATLWEGKTFTQDEPVAYPRVDGTQGWLTFSLSAVPDTAAADGEPPYQALMIWRDVSENHRLREEVQRLVYRDGLSSSSPSRRARVPPSACS